MNDEETGQLSPKDEFRRDGVTITKTIMTYLVSDRFSGEPKSSMIVLWRPLSRSGDDMDDEDDELELESDS